MGPATTALKKPQAGSCGLTSPSALVTRSVTAAGQSATEGFARTGGAIVISFDTTATHAEHLVGDGRRLLGIRSVGRSVASGATVIGKAKCCSARRVGIMGAGPAGRTR